MKPSPEEEGRIIAQSRFDVNEEMSAHDDFLQHGASHEFLTANPFRLSRICRPCYVEHLLITIRMFACKDRRPRMVSQRMQENM
jgi:hypothetical protein